MTFEPYMYLYVYDFGILDKEMISIWDRAELNDTRFQHAAQNSLQLKKIYLLLLGMQIYREEKSQKGRSSIPCLVYSPSHRSGWS